MVKKYNYATGKYEYTTDPFWMAVTKGITIDRQNLPRRKGDNKRVKAKHGTRGSFDWDPNNPYHYHTNEGKKVVITQEDWEANKGKPYFKEVEAAVNAERAAYPGPEYEVDQNYVNRLNRTYSSRLGSTNGAYNFRGYTNQLPKGYTISDQGVIYDNEGNAYVQDWFTHRDYPYDVNSPITFTFNKGKGSERNEEFYPIKLKTTIKKPLQVDRTLPVEKTKERLINEYIKTNSKKQKLYNVPWFEEIHRPHVYMYGNKSALVAPIENQSGIGDNWYAFDIYGDKGEDPINIDNAEQYSSSHYISEEEMLRALNSVPQNIDISDRDVILKPSFWEAGYKSIKPTREEALQHILISPEETNAVTNINRPKRLLGGDVPKGTKEKGNFTGVPNTKNSANYDKKYNSYKASNPNVTLGGKVVPLNNFGNYFKQLGWLESSLDPNATNGTYSGYWAQRNAGGKPFADQFKSLIGHHNRMLKDMVVEDYEAAKAKGFNDAEIMAKYHNQGRRSFDYYHNNRDHTDGNGTKISQYGNGMSPISVLPSLVTQHALPGDYYILKDGQSLGSIENRVRVKGVNPANNIPYLLKVNGEKYNGRRKITVVNKQDKKGKNPRVIAINEKYDPKNDSVVNILSRAGDTIYFRK